MSKNSLIERPRGVIMELSRVRLRKYFEAYARHVPLHVIESLLGLGHHGVCIACWTVISLAESCQWGRRQDGLPLDGFAEGLIHDQGNCIQHPGIEVFPLTFEHLDELFEPVFARHAEDACRPMQKVCARTVPAPAIVVPHLRPKKHNKQRFIHVPSVRRNS